MPSAARAVQASARHTEAAAATAIAPLRTVLELPRISLLYGARSGFVQLASATSLGAGV